MKIDFRLDDGFIDVWNDNDYQWDRYVICNKKETKSVGILDTLKENEVIEEDKKIKKIKTLNVDNTFNPTDVQVVYDIRTLKNKINEIADKINDLEELKPTIIDGSKIQLCGYNTSDQVDY